MPGNVDLIRSGFEVFRREGPEALLALADPDIEVHAEQGLVNAGTYRGTDEFLRWQQRWLDAWEEFTAAPREFIEVSDHLVVVPLRQVATGKGSGIPVEMDINYLFEVRGGKITRFHLYADVDRAVAAARRIAEPQ